MVSTFTPSKSLEEPASGDYTNTWATPVNADWSAIDTAFGGTGTVNVVAATGTVALTINQYRPPNIVFSGALTANVNYQLPSGVGGLWTMYNNTSGAFTITISSADGGTTITLTQGNRTMIVSGTGGIAIATTATVTVAGSNTQIQYNNGGALGASSLLTFDGTNLVTRGLKLSGATSGTITISPPAIAGSASYILPGADGSAGFVLSTNGSGTLSWISPNSISGVSSFSAGSTGFTPNSATTGAITLGGTLNVGNGGTGLTSYATGDILYASGGSTIARLAAAASGNVLLSGTSPSWGKVALASAVSGTLPVANGGTGATTFTVNALLKGNGASALSSGIVYDTGSAVGINTASPAFTLTVAGDIATASGGDVVISSAIGSVNAVLFNDNNDLSISVNSSTRMYFAASGNVGIANGSPAEKLDVTGNIKASGTMAAGGNITSGGDITATGNVTAYSDVRLKTDFQRILGALDKVKLLTGYTFTRTDLPDHPRQTGLIAQEVYSVLPEAVDDSGEYMSIAYGNLAGLLIEAIKEIADDVARLRWELNL